MGWCNFGGRGVGWGAEGLTPPPEVQGWSTAQMNIIPCQLCPRVSNLSVQSLSPANCLYVPNFALFEAGNSQQSKKQLKLGGKAGCEAGIEGSSVCKGRLLGGPNAPGLGLCSRAILVITPRPSRVTQSENN